MLQVFLQESKFNFKGITITIDELGKHVEYAGSNQRDGDIYILQELAEHYVKESKIPVFFNVMLHQAIEFYAKDLDKETKNEWRILDFGIGENLKSMNRNNKNNSKIQRG